MQYRSLAIAAVIALVAWRVVATTRRLIARQQSRLWRHRAAVLVFPFLIGLLLLGALGQTEAQLALAGGTAVGASLAVIGFRRTRFEAPAEGGFFFTPCAPIGIGLAALLFGRMAYRGLVMFEARGAASPGLHTFALTPMTLFVFATLTSYYSAFSLGLLLWRARVERMRR